ncbi:MAG TPA: DinB family protein [Candidatus Dormibacteraeota bacterium]|nr:DinB family protein [Candidatus Dormibacteraeota bacterium]
MSAATGLAAEFEATNQAVISFASARSDEEWQRVCPGENWPLAGVIRHIAAGYSTAQGWVHGYLEGQPTPIDPEEIDRRNEARAEEFAKTSRATALDLLAKDGDAVVQLVGGLTDEQLSITHAVLSGRELTTAQLVKILIRHTRGHLGSAQSACGLA